MSFFKRIFGRLFGGKKKSTAKAQGGECWYNNAHEMPKDKWVEMPEGGAFSSPDSYFYSTAQQAAKQQ